MKRLLYTLLIALTAAACTPRDRYITVTGFAQGGTYSVKLNLKGTDVRPEAIRDSVDAILVNIDNSLSGYNRKSLLSRFNAGEEIVPDSLFTDIYDRAVSIFEETDGVVDPASAPLFDLWGFGFTEGEMPSESTLRQVMSESGMGRLKADMVEALQDDGHLDGREMLLESAGDTAPELNYNAIAQGYSCDVVARYLYSIGVKDMLVDIGEIFCDGVNPSGQPWSIGIDRPVDGNQEPGAEIHGIFRAPAGPHGIVTSGNYRKFYIRNGRKYAHTIDPRTGRPVNHNLLSATVVAPDATIADAYATYCMVIGLEESKAFLESRPDLEGCLIYDHEGEFRTWCSSGFILE
ncbi:MAG: FAD:protein FMN transferase [Bacteroidales bacterium]|nr:FAD:protein FMN transferase [Bacteroidales bacterium]